MEAETKMDRMATVAIREMQQPEISRIAQWYAIYTCVRHEKVVARQLGERSIETFLPLYQSARRWKDRRKLIELALFPGYVFVKIAIKDRLQVLKVPGVVSLVGFNGHFPVVPESEITALRRGIEGRLRTMPHPYLRVGRRVRVKHGPMKGVEGILSRKRDRCRVVISIDVLMRSVAVEIDAMDLEPLGGFQSKCAEQS